MTRLLLALVALTGCATYQRHYVLSDDLQPPTEGSLGPVDDVEPFDAVYFSTKASNVVGSEFGAGHAPILYLDKYSRERYVQPIFREGHAGPLVARVWGLRVEHEGAIDPGGVAGTVPGAVEIGAPLDDASRRERELAMIVEKEFDPETYDWLSIGNLNATKAGKRRGPALRLYLVRTANPDVVLFAPVDGAGVFVAALVMRDRDEAMRRLGPVEPQATERARLEALIAKDDYPAAQRLYLDVKGLGGTTDFPAWTAAFEAFEDSLAARGSLPSLRDEVLAYQAMQQRLTDESRAKGYDSARELRPADQRAFLVRIAAVRHALAREAKRSSAEARRAELLESLLGLRLYTSDVLCYGNVATNVVSVRAALEEMPDTTAPRPFAEVLASAKELAKFQGDTKLRELGEQTAATTLARAAAVERPLAEGRGELARAIILTRLEDATDPDSPAATARFEERRKLLRSLLLDHLPLVDAASATLLRQRILERGSPDLASVAWPTEAELAARGRARVTFEVRMPDPTMTPPAYVNGNRKVTLTDTSTVANPAARAWLEERARLERAVADAERDLAAAENDPASIASSPGTSVPVAVTGAYVSSNGSVSYTTQGGQMTAGHSYRTDEGKAAIGAARGRAGELRQALEDHLAKKPPDTQLETRREDVAFVEEAQIYYAKGEVEVRRTADGTTTSWKGPPEKLIMVSGHRRPSVGGRPGEDSFHTPAAARAAALEQFRDLAARHVADEALALYEQNVAATCRKVSRDECDALDVVLRNGRGKPGFLEGIPYPR